MAFDGDGGLLLTVNGTKEYGDQPRKAGEGWPHLLVEQDASSRIALDQIKDIELGITLQLTDFVIGMKPPVCDPNLHAAQFQLFLNIQNIDAKSKDYRDYYWFGVPFFDSRHNIPLPYMAADQGKQDATGKFIYTIAGREVNPVPLISGVQVTLTNNLLPLILAGLNMAEERGYLADKQPAHYAVTNMNLGWEMPGTYDASMRISGLNIQAQLLENH